MEGLELRWAGLVPTGGFAPIILLGFDDTFELQPRLQVEKSAKPPNRQEITGKASIPGGNKLQPSRFGTLVAALEQEGSDRNPHLMTSDKSPLSGL